MNFFSKNLEYLRTQKGMTRNELANKLKVNQSTISRWENGDMGITVDNAYDVADFFNVSMSDLTGKDMSLENKPFDELDLLFSKNKDILTDEDKEYMIPSGYDTLLKNFYGDYMIPPPPEKRVSTHGIEVYLEQE